MKKKCNLKVVFDYPLKLDGVVKKAKDKISKLEYENVLYKVSCNGCNKYYVLRMSKLLETRQVEHQNYIECNDQYYNIISKHILDSQLLCNSYSMNWDEIEILRRRKN